MRYEGDNKVTRKVVNNHQAGKYQTLGGSIFQIGTVCTIATFDPYDMETGGGDIGENQSLLCRTQHRVNVFLSGYSSRKRNPDGDWNNATGTLTELDHPGHFSQELVFGDFQGPAVDYNVVWLDEESAIE